ncbi:ABC transporter substrate-binding protein [Plantactinospora sp. KBS50]|uniref:peptide ABC transporter substrate-binding protein n=1 Tax=Plantactinospora sp. KBS50 TaxID=2024580 RepID=UPI000BAA99F7|nr:ABC transporter substrate-binding protein [Plantactinospora sp. KBS50]ASW53630.1 peptide ABC transporter substrate-binding protein [Plantactinospora sp. KBS50]
MRVSKRAGAVALGAAFVLVAAGCGSGGGSDDAGGTANGSITIDGVQPESPLVPADTNETGGGNIIDKLWSGLVRYPNDGGEPVNSVAESIETGDSKVYTIKIKQGLKFHDGTEVQAHNFVDAWNWAAYGPNGAKNSSFFSDIDGFNDVYTEDPDGPDGPEKAPKPKAEKMKGLEVVDDYTFKVTLAAPFSIFPVKLGYSAFYPMPDAFFKADPADFGKNPIGNGPLKFVSWEPNVEVKLTRNEDYQLDDKSAVKDVTVKLYQDANAAYQDLVAGNLDFMQQVPVSALAGDKWKTDLDDRTINVPVPTSAKIDFPIYDEKFKNANLRKAISMAVDRASITDKIFSGSKKPANSWANPLSPGAKDGNCTVCDFKPDEAKQLLQEAGGFTGTLNFYYNGDASHKEWMEAVAQSVANTLGIDAKAVSIPTFAQFRQQINAHKMDGPYRAAWQQDYPDVENWIGPLFVTGGSSNNGGYSNPDVDKLYREGTSAPSVEAAHDKFAAAVEKLDQDVPSIPVYFYNQQSGYSEKIKRVETNSKGPIDLSSVELS